MNQSYLKECVQYDPATGLFVWLDRPSSHFKSAKAHKIFSQLYAGKPCGSRSKEGYHLIRIDGLIYKAHRLAWLHQNGGLPTEWLDHINRDRADNRIANLRLATPTLNALNATQRKDNTSGVVGVSIHKVTQKWVAQISVHGAIRHLGLFSTIADAKAARLSAEAEFRGSLA